MRALLERLGPGRHPGAWIGLSMAAVTAVVWLAAGSVANVARFWDGPHYLYLAKTLYRVPEDHPFGAYQLTRAYFACHLPLYPLLIRLLSLLTGGDYPLAMLIATLGTSVAAAVLFHRLLVRERLVESPGWTAIYFCLLPPRWVLYHSTGATEPLFICCLLAALLAYRSGHPPRVALAVALGSLTRITGVLLVPVFAALYLARRDRKAASWVTLALVTPLALGAFHAWMFGNPFAYFRWNSSLLRAEPLQVVRSYAYAGAYQAGELDALLYLAYAAGTLALWPRRDLFAVSAVLVGFHLFVFHSDLARYLLPAAPLALLIGFDPVLRLKPVRWALPLLLYLSLLYTAGSLTGNRVDNNTWRRLLVVLGPGSAHHAAR